LRVMPMLLVVYVVCTLVACGQGNSGAATPTDHPTKTPVAQPTTTKAAISNGPLGLTATAIELHVKSFVISAL